MMFQVAGGIIIAVGLLGLLAMVGEAIDGSIRRAHNQADAEKSAKQWRAHRERQLYGPIEDLKAELARTTNERQRLELKVLMYARSAFETDRSSTYGDEHVLVMLRDEKARAKWLRKHGLVRAAALP